MNGFEVATLQVPGLFSRGRVSKANALIEIRNAIAVTPLHNLQAQPIPEILKRYGVAIQDTEADRRDIYRTVVTHCAADLELSAEDRGGLAQLQTGLALTREAVQECEAAALQDIYRTALVGALADGHLSDDEKAKLDRAVASFALPEERVKAIFAEEAVKVLQWALNRAVADRRLSADEESGLQAMAENLGVTIAHDEASRRAMDRFRLLARIEAGEIPTLEVPIALQRGERCHGTMAASLYELRTRTERVQYSRPTASIKIIGNLRWRMGSINVQRVQRDVMTQLDSGTLYFTSKRLLFDGAKKNTQTPLKKIVRFTVYSDGLQIQKESGRDQYFIGSADTELLGAVLETTLRMSRQ